MYSIDAAHFFMVCFQCSLPENAHFSCDIKKYGIFMTSKVIEYNIIFIKLRKLFNSTGSVHAQKIEADLLNLFFGTDLCYIFV